MKAIILITIAAIAWAGPAAAQTAPKQTLILPKMAGWAPTSPAVVNGVVTQQWLPPGQDEMHWSEMAVLTSIGKRGSAALLSEALLQNFQSRCGHVDVLARSSDEEVDTGLPKDDPATYKTSSIFLHCQDPPPPAETDAPVRKHEIAWIKIIEGQGATFMLQRDWHGDELTPDCVLNSQQVRQEWRSWFAQARLVSQPVPPR